MSDHQINGCGGRIGEPMEFNIKLIALFLVVASAFATLPCMGGGCGASCAVSGGSSYNFMGDPAFNIGMSSFDEFVRDNLGQTSLSTRSLSTDNPSSANSSLNQTSNLSQTEVEALPAINSSGNMSSIVRQSNWELQASRIRRYQLWSLLPSITSFKRTAI